MVGVCELATAPTMVAMRLQEQGDCHHARERKPQARPAGALDGRASTAGFCAGRGELSLVHSQRAHGSAPNRPRRWRYRACTARHAHRAAGSTRLSKDEQRGIPPLGQEYGIRDVGSRVHVAPGYTMYLALHTIGLVFLVGPNLLIAARILGVAPRLPLAPMRSYVPIMNVGFVHHAHHRLGPLCHRP